MEVEAHPAGPNDNFGKVVGVQVAILAVVLSIFTILAHRAHTDTILFSNEASNDWAHYQAKRNRAYQLDMNTSMIELMAPNSAEVAQTLKDNQEAQVKYAKELETIKAQAEKKEKDEAAVHLKAGFFDLAEALVEIAVILSSLYFISRKKFFPMFGLLLGAIGVIIGLLGLMNH